MTEQEYENVKHQERFAAEIRRENDELQQKYDDLAVMVLEAIREDKDGFPRTTTRKCAAQLLEKAREILGIKGGEQ